MSAPVTVGGARQEGQVVAPMALPARPLPVLLVVADSAAAGGRPLVEVVGAAVSGGARAVWLRDKEAAPEERRLLAAQLAGILHRSGGLLIASPGPGSEVADGTQLGATSPGPKGLAGGTGHSPAGQNMVGQNMVGQNMVGQNMVGRSCHSFSELEKAAAEGCRWATLSPIFATGSKPGYGPALGTGALARSPLPTWALGGVNQANAPECIRAGAAGVAVMGAVMKAKDPAATVAALLVCLSEVER
jgi:thiamine-phosphate pyrophosphorylase